MNDWLKRREGKVGLLVGCVFLFIISGPGTLKNPITKFGQAEACKLIDAFEVG